MVRSVIGVALLAVAGSAFAAGPTWNALPKVGIDYMHNQNMTTVSAPEISPAGAISALTLVFGGLAMVRGRRKG